MAESKSAKFHSKISRNYDKLYENRYWDINGRVEWSRINTYLPNKKSSILDAGGGTGEFAIKFAKKGHRVVMTEVSSGMLKVAQAKIKKQKMERSIRLLYQDITDMKELRANSFDFVISVGDPVSYCMNEARAIKELARVAKRGAYVLITVDSYFSTLIKILKCRNDKELAKLEKSGKTTFPFDYPQHNFKVAELRNLFEKNGLEVIEIFGLSNLMNKIDKPSLKKILSNDSGFRKLLKLEMKYSAEPAVIGTAGHLGIVGRKR